MWDWPFILPAQWPHASDYAALMAPTTARLFTLNSSAKPFVDLKQSERLNAAFARFR
jgi:hypothetical protein